MALICSEGNGTRNSLISLKACNSSRGDYWNRPASCCFMRKCHTKARASSEPIDLRAGSTARRIRASAPPKESHRKNLTADTYAPMGFLGSLHYSCLQTFLKSLLRLQDTMTRLHLKRLYARWIDGTTHLWIGRPKNPGQGEGSSGLQFDSVESPGG